MSGIVGFVGMSHCPFATMTPPAAATEPGGTFMADAARVCEAVATLAPDAIVLIGPDHFHANFYDAMPPFLLGVESAEAFGDFGTTSGPLRLNSELAWSLQRSLTDKDFDLTLSYSVTVDHGIAQTYKMLTGGVAIPLVPIVVNTAAPPLPTLGRCVALGRALGESLRESRFGGDVLVVASGGLSHWLPSNDPRDPSVSAEKRATLIHGRQDVRAVANAREPHVRALAGNPSARVNADWDRWFLDQIRSGDLDPIVALGNQGVEDNAGSGGQEIRCWLIGQAAVDQPVLWTSYEPVPEWITGMAIVTTFDVA